MNIPPLALTIALGVLAADFNLWLPLATIDFSGKNTIGLVLSATGFCILMASVGQFFRSRTTVNPTAPKNSTTLVTTGLFRFSRNPMYLAMALELGAVGLFLGSLGAFVGVFLFIIWMTIVQIPTEERVLRRVFGTEYDDYLQKVRRWI